MVILASGVVASSRLRAGPETHAQPSRPAGAADDMPFVPAPAPLALPPPRPEAPRVTVRDVPGSQGVETPTPTPANGAPSGRHELALVALRRPGGSVVLRDLTHGNEDEVQVGGDAFGYRVESIDGRVIRLHREGQSLDLPLADAEPEEATEETAAEESAVEMPGRP